MIVTIENSNEDIVATMRELIQKMRSNSCRRCLMVRDHDTLNCISCMTKWHDCRNGCLRIFRSVFEVPKEYDVPPIMLHHCSKIANEQRIDLQTNLMMFALDVLRQHHADGSLQRSLGGTQTCPSCNAKIPSSQYNENIMKCNLCLKGENK